jgi:hypothetical protein
VNKERLFENLEDARLLAEAGAEQIHNQKLLIKDLQTSGEDLTDALEGLLNLNTSRDLTLDRIKWLSEQLDRVNQSS